MTEVIRRSMSYTQGVGRTGSFKLTLPGMYGSVPRCITVCEACGQSHDMTRNHLYDYPVEVDDDLQCQICLQPLVDPVDTPCGHTFCYACMINHLRRSQSCPCDRQPLCERDIKSSSVIVRKILDKLRVVCPNTAYCDATMPRSSLERHLRLNCPGTYIQCPREREGCRHVGPRSQLEEHLWSCSYGQDRNHRTGKLVPVTEGHISVVEIPKGDSDLGLIVSQCERTGIIVIEDVLVEGNAYRDGRLLPGDQVLEINNQNFTNKSIAQARLALASLNPLMRLTVLRNPSQEEVSADTELIELVKDEHKPLGIQIHSYKHRAGIFIHHLVAGSPADECGCIRVGDRVLEANGCDLRYSTIDEAAVIMAKSERLIRLVVEHRSRLSSGSASSCRSNHSSSAVSMHSDRSHKSPVSPSDRSSRASSSGGHSQHNKHYEELVFAPPTEFPIGSRKSIIIKKAPGSNIGFTISGGSSHTEHSEHADLPVFVSSIKAGTPIDSCGTVVQGDIIMSINGTTLYNKTHSEAIEIMQSLIPTSIVRLVLLQGDLMFDRAEGSLSPDWRDWVDKYNTYLNNSPIEYTVTLSRQGTQSLGFSIVGGVNSSRGDSPIYVKGIAPKSIAEQDGRLQCRDEITSINSIPVAGKTQSEVVDIIKSCSGDVTLTIIPHDVYC